MKKFKKALLIDDDSIANYMNREILQDMELFDDIVVCTSGNEALVWCVENDNDSENLNLILLDINMPGIDGFEFIENLRKYGKYSHVPIVLLTTSDNQRDKGKADKFVVQGYLNKPLSEDKVKEMLGNLSD